MSLFIQPLLGYHASAPSPPNFSHKNPSNLVYKHSLPLSIKHDIFVCLESAVRQGCKLYSRRVLDKGASVSALPMLDHLKTTVEKIPEYTHGEHSLAWVCFVAAAESSTADHRFFFADRLEAIYKRAGIDNISYSLGMLHKIWEAQSQGRSWEEQLKPMPHISDGSDQASTPLKVGIS